MEIVLTGTGSPLPDANRAGPSTLVKAAGSGEGAGETHVLVDAGRGTVMRMTAAGSLPAFTTAATVHAPVRPTIGYRLEHAGSVAAIVGDTIPCDGVDELATGADAYVQTVIRRDLVKLVPNETFQDILDYHSGVVEAAQTAARVGARRLVLTHLVPAPTPEQYPEWVARAAEHCDGEIVIGDDLTTVTI